MTLNEHLKFVLTILAFVFGLGVGYQRLESHIDAQQTSLQTTVEERLKSVEDRNTLERSYIQQDLKDIKLQLLEIQKYLRDKN